MAVGDEPDDRRELEARLALLEAKLAERGVELAERDVRLAEQATKITALPEQVAKLTEVLGQNSKNSHRPPWSDGPSSGAGGTASSRRSAFVAV